MPVTHRSSWRTTTGAILTSLVLALAAALATILTAAPAAAQSQVLLDDDFEAGTGAWSTAGGNWSVQGAAGSRTYHQGNNSGNARALAGQAGWSNVSVEASVRPTGFNAGSGSAFAAVLARVQGTESYYYLTLRNNNQLEINKLVNGSRTLLASTSASVQAGTWYQLRLEVTGGQLTGYLNGQQRLSASDNQFPTGRVGLKTFNATGEFDNVRVTSPSQAGAGARYVAPNGNDSNPGTLAQPLRTVQRAVDLAQPGDTIYLRGGTYAPSTNIRILHSGTASQRITLRNYQNERVVIDGDNMPHTPAPVGADIPRIERGAIHIAASYWHLIGLEIINGPYGIFGINSSNNIYENLVTRDNYETGLHLFLSSSNNLILNLDSYRNRDPRKNGGSADGLAIKEGSGTGNVVRGARLWHNSDDGLDFWEFGSPVLVEDSLAWGNGVNRWGLPNFGGHGIGFKLGGSSTPPTGHTVRNSMAWDNAHHGVSDNGNAGSHRIERSTSWRNDNTGFQVNRSSSTLAGNLAVANGNRDVDLGSGSGGSGNSWNLGGSWPLANTNPSVITGPRQADGSIPSSTFLQPANGANVGARF